MPLARTRIHAATSSGGGARATLVFCLSSFDSHLQSCPPLHKVHTKTSSALHPASPRHLDVRRPRYPTLSFSICIRTTAAAFVRSPAFDIRRAANGVYDVSALTVQQYPPPAPTMVWFSPPGCVTATKNPSSPVIGVLKCFMKVFLVSFLAIGVSNLSV